MQHALPHLPTQRVTAIVAAIAIGGGLGAVAIANNAGEDTGGATPPTVAAPSEPTGGSAPTPSGGAQHRVAPSTAGHAAQPVGGARP